jgi:cytochrome c553
MKANHYTTQQQGLGKVGLLAVIAVLALAGAALFYGPGLLGAMRFMESVDQIGASHSQASAGELLSRNCGNCHGARGNGDSQFYPRLAGQPVDYLRNQLLAFQAGTRTNPAMSTLTMSMSTEQIDDVAGYFASQAATANASFTADPELVVLGERKAREANCAACHGGGYEGQAPYPRLAGQGYTYLSNQLKNFRDGQRQDADGVMAALAAPLSDQDIEHLSHYLATQ